MVGKNTEHSTMINQKIELEEHQEAYWLVFSGDRIVTLSESPSFVKGTASVIQFASAYIEQCIQVGEHRGLPCMVIDMQSEQIDDDAYTTRSLRSLFLHNKAEMFEVVARAWQIVLFRRTHQFCGRCGDRMQQIDWEMAMHCPSCGHRCYPRISPCIIVAVRRENKILLAQGASQKERKMWSILAGFVESGESLEQAVHREVFEEVGIKVKNLEYFGSQPWPFPHSLMVGYLAEYDDGDIVVDGKEIHEAYWCDIDDLPFVPPNLSIAGRLIEHTVKMFKK